VVCRAENTLSVRTSDKWVKRGRGWKEGTAKLPHPRPLCPESPPAHKGKVCALG